MSEQDLVVQGLAVAFRTVLLVFLAVWFGMIAYQYFFKVKVRKAQRARDKAKAELLAARAKERR